MADLVVHDGRAIEWTPRGDVGLQLVWGAKGRAVRDVVVAGNVVVRDRRCVTVDERAIADEAAKARVWLLERAGISVPHPWPHVPAE